MKRLQQLRELDAVYISMPVNNKKMESSHVTVSYDGKVIEDKRVPVSEAKFVSYYFENLKNRETGMYIFAFYDSNDKINAYLSVILG